MANNLVQRRAPGSVQPFVTLNPAPVTDANRAPTAFDNYEPSTIWIQPRDVAGNPVNDIWILASTQDAVANWIQVAQSGGDATFDNITVTDTATINTLTVTGDATVGDDLDVGGVIRLPFTNLAGTEGVIFVNGVRFAYAPGVDNTFYGSAAGNLAVAGSQITGIGDLSLTAVTTAINVTAVGANSGLNLTSASNSTLIGRNSGVLLTTALRSTLIGSSSGSSITTGTNNCALGFESLSALVNGTANIALGTQAGIGLTANDSNNIIIGNNGIPGDNNTIRLGTPGGTHLNTFIAGNVDAELNVIASQALFAQGDPGVGGLSETGITNVVNTTQGAGALTLLSANGNSGTNTGFMKFYVNGVAVFVPYFADITP